MPEQRSTFDYVSEIWSIAEYVRDVIRPADYNKLVLPFALLREIGVRLGADPRRGVQGRGEVRADVGA